MKEHGESRFREQNEEREGDKETKLGSSFLHPQRQQTCVRKGRRHSTTLPLRAKDRILCIFSTTQERCKAAEEALEPVRTCTRGGSSKRM
jgi:hypothetical protein